MPKPKKQEWPADKVDRIPIDKLIPYARNARTHSDAQVAQIAASMKEWGWTTPCLIDEDGSIIAGHGRVLAARQVGITEVPCMTAKGWTEAQKRAYILADNQLALNSSWDMEMLRLEIGEIDALNFDIDKIGFDQSFIDALFGAEPEAPEDFGEHDESIDTEHQCPKCGYRWSGNSGPSDAG